MRDAVAEQVRRLEARLERERRARREAERIAEDSLRSAYLHQEQLTLLERVARLANESRDPRATIGAALELLCAFGGWPAARARLLGDGVLPEEGAWYPAAEVEDPSRLPWPPPTARGSPPRPARRRCGLRRRGVSPALSPPGSSSPSRSSPARPWRA